MLRVLNCVLALLAIQGASAADDEDQQCGLYLAISSTSTVDDTNWGIFAGKNIPAKTEIVSPDVAINIPHLRPNSSPVEADEETDTEFLSRMVDFFEGFFWVPETAAAQFELTEGRAVTAIPGPGVLAGYSPKRTNADWSIISSYKRPLMGETPGASHPARGAHSPFYNAAVVSTQDIKAGSEIFMEYGESWGHDENEDDLNVKDYTRIDETVEQMIDFFKKHKDSLDEDAKAEVYTFLIKDVMKAAVGAAKSRRVQTLLPPNPDDLYKIIEAGGSLKYSDPTVHRSQEWLEQYGLCIDNLRVGPSTIPNAGRGAFSTRKIAAGGLVVPIPLTHVPDKTILDMHALELNDNGQYVRKSDEVVTQQLFLNYCFGHPESSMVFFPTGAVAAMINHSDEPNAKIVWSKHPSHQKTWSELDPTELLDEEHMYLGLVIEIVATKDIKEGEEVFIDYGPEWRAAYAKHVEEWNAKVAAGEIPKKWPLRAVDLNDQYKSKPFKTAAEVAAEPYPENVQLKAFLLLQDTDNAGTVEDPKLWGEDENESAYHHDHIFDVAVLDHEKDENSKYIYKIQWVNQSNKATVVDGVPHDALLFVDKPGTSDHYTANAFRHFIGIPDDIFPQGPWRNLKEE